MERHRHCGSSGYSERGFVGRHGYQEERLIVPVFRSVQMMIDMIWRPDCRFFRLQVINKNLGFEKLGATSWIFVTKGGT